MLIAQRLICIFQCYFEYESTLNCDKPLNFSVNLSTCTLFDREWKALQKIFWNQLDQFTRLLGNEWKRGSWASRSFVHGTLRLNCSSDQFGPKRLSIELLKSYRTIYLQMKFVEKQTSYFQISSRTCHRLIFVGLNEDNFVDRGQTDTCITFIVGWRAFGNNKRRHVTSRALIPFAGWVWTFCAASW
jgi:hypothetical protein